ncbi:MAG: U32 family peptidase [Clostridiales bacterium]|nr:U32 family peptidase [Clostridiales bacterium]
MSEILAPAGNKNCAYSAINAGADAIYLGLKNFSARSSAENFDFSELEEICTYAHALGVKVYVAMNTLIKDSELSAFLNDAACSVNAGADALIISDIFLGAYIKNICPEIELHLSTQAGICNVYGARLAKDYGFSRVILSRETAFSDIADIAKIIETEVFIQGALCTCFSGQCYLSSFAGGNSGNRGKCKQPCRKLYSIDRIGYEEQAYRLSLSDLSIGRNIEKLLDAGVFSFKIEGRMRRSEYVCAAVEYYKTLLCGESGDRQLSNLKRTYNRGNYTKGLAFGQDKSFISSRVQGHIGEFVGIVNVENGKYLCDTKAKFSDGDCFKILRNGKEVGGAKFGGTTHSKPILTTNAHLKNGDKVFITTDAELNKNLLSKRKSIKIELSAQFNSGEKAKININGNEYFSESILEPSVSRPLTSEDIINCFKKIDKYPFEVIFGAIQTDGVFVASSQLNGIRRKVYAEFYSSLSQKSKDKINLTYKSYDDKCVQNNKTAVICGNLNDLKADIGILKLTDFSLPYNDLITRFDGEKYLYLPPYIRGEEISKFKEIIKDFDGIYSDGIYAVKLCEEVNKPLFAGTGLNISNEIDVGLCNAKYIALSKEINCAEAKRLSRENTFYLVAGDIKAMDLIYCPFGKKCSACDKRKSYVLTDESGRKFTLKRYKIGENCRFELYNCACLVSGASPVGKLIDLSVSENAGKVLQNLDNENALKEIFINYTRGHSVNSVN